jgi:GNAT superfamily N-acetyltransferase
VSEVTYATSLQGITVAALDGGFFEGWPTPPTPEAHLAILRGSEAVVLALDPATGHVVGFVTAIGDGVLAASIPLLEVLPAWRGQGIGSALVRRMVDVLGPRYMVDLVCDDDLVPFYASLGFTRYGAMIRRDRAAIMTLRDRFAGDAGHPTDHHDEEERP